MKKSILLLTVILLSALTVAMARTFYVEKAVNVKVKKTDSQTYSDMYAYLRGRVPGVTVTSDNRIIIRGIGTNSDATDPLILVDGVQVTDLSSINPADVKSVDVIKDGSSAIYGMQGANGVIIIKTIGSGD